MNKENIAAQVQKLLVQQYGFMNTQTTYCDGYTVVTVDTPEKKHIRVVIQVFDKP